MQMVETALGRLVPVSEAQTYLEDAILKLLFNYRMDPQNPNNVPMKLDVITRAVNADRGLVIAALDALREDRPALVEEHAELQGEKTFSITGQGVRFIRNLPQDIP